MSSVRRRHFRARHLAMPKAASRGVRISWLAASHVDDWLDDAPSVVSDGEAAARAWLAQSRLPASHPRKHDDPGFRVTCAWRGRRYWLARASAMGDVALKRTPPLCVVGAGYCLRVPIDEVSEFRRELSW